MEYCKLQIGCLIAVLYIIFIYIKEKQRFHMSRSFTLYDGILVIGAFCLIMDGTTAYTVNHLDQVNDILNRVLHGMFLVSIDTLIFTLFLYIMSETGYLEENKKRLLLFCVPYMLNVLVVMLGLNSLEYRVGSMSNYSMGISAYTCFIMAGVYIASAVWIFFRRWRYIQMHRRVSIFTCLLVVIGVTSYQMAVPDALVTSVGTMMIILGTYMNQEDPAMRELSRYHEEMVMGFATLIENRDDNTGGHVKRTTRYAALLAEEIQRRGYYRDILTKDYIHNLLLAAPMHDVGKIAIPDAILQKPGKLTDEEFDIMKQHTVRGGEIIRETFGRMGNEQYMEIAYQIARHHHEKWNGKGYPDGLKEEEIPLCARIMAIADVFDAVSENRCYRAAMPMDQCFDIIRDGSGRDFEPILAEAFLDMREKVVNIFVDNKR
ncbi:MAG: HD domain-containing protein [Frisingicoccus sp.]|uniref:HD-GYP domain-containing protein n=1 Tax=Frisingicoccus sp. TaxID=1918627 RepID=UPI002615016A|nr:HD domain-containing phosphohydrolase [Frisingicoccus sp.]MDD6232964.1 HD domain-containing protein [Frisingicoccus sp.]